MMFDMVIGAALEAVHQNDHDRELSIARPSRSVSAVRQAVLTSPRWRPFARCVENRESHGQAHVLNHGGSGAQGLFQFMPSWNHGGPYMVRDRLVQFGLGKAQARKVRVWLSARPIHRWPAPYQRMLFAEAVERGGWRHWSGHTCNALVP